MTQNSTIAQKYEYQASPAYVGIFYLFLVAWILFCAFFVFRIVSEQNISYLFGLIMIVFIAGYTCYFSLALAYKIEVWENGRIVLTSLRRTIVAQAEEIPYVEGPHLPVGFIRFRLAREKGYLFAIINDDALKQVLTVIHQAAPDMQFKHLSPKRLS